MAFRYIKFLQDVRKFPANIFCFENFPALPTRDSNSSLQTLDKAI